METVEDEAAEPHPFLALVLARMKTNPEEFNPDNSQWRVILDQSIRYLTAGEKTALRDAEREVALGYLHKKAMKKLLADKTPTPSQAFVAFNTTDIGVSTATRPRNIYSTTLGGASSTAYTALRNSTGQSYEAMFERILERLNDLDNRD
jgi:hypothetical protein